jgi:hypothetical protein
MQVDRTTAQKRASRAYRARLENAGIKRFEITAPAQDRTLLRALAARLAQGGEAAARLRAEVAKKLDGGEPDRGGVLAALRRAPPEVAELELERVEIEPRPLEL